MNIVFAIVMCISGVWLLTAGLRGRDSLFKIGPFKFFGGGDWMTSKMFGSRHHQIVNLVLGLIFLMFGLYVVLEHFSRDFLL